MSPSELPPQNELPAQEFEMLAQQVPVSWSWRTLGSLMDHAASAADGIAFDAVNGREGGRIAMIVCVTRAEEIVRMEKILGRPSETEPSPSWAQATLFQLALRTALQGGFTYEGARDVSGKRMGITVCSVGQKGMRVVESLFKQPGATAARAPEEGSAIDRIRVEAEGIIARLALPEDVRGRTISFPAFGTEEDCAFFHQGRTREEHERIFATVQTKLFSRGVQFSRSKLTAAVFAEAGRHAGDPTNWAERRIFLVPTARGTNAPANGNSAA